MKKFLKILGFILGVPILLLFVFICYVSYEGDYKAYRGLKFDRDIWDNDGDLVLGGKDSVYGTNLSCKMYDDLSKNHLRKGMKFKEVEDLLGKDYLLKYCLNKKVKCIKYALGTCYASSWTLSHGWINICFDSNQEIVRFDNKIFEEKICDWKNSAYFDKGEWECVNKRIREDGTVCSNTKKCPVEIEPW